jgi:hypothetical protein
MPFFGVLRGILEVFYPSALSLFVFDGQSALKRLKTASFQTEKLLTPNKQLFLLTVTATFIQKVL